MPTERNQRLASSDVVTFVGQTPEVPTISFCGSHFVSKNEGDVTPSLVDGPRPKGGADFIPFRLQRKLLHRSSCIGALADIVSAALAFANI